MATHTPQQRLVLWVIWGSLFSSLFMYRAFLGGQESAQETAGTIDAFLLTMLIVPAAASVFIRWIVLPKAKDVPQTLVLMIVGIALAESVIFYGLFIFPDFEDLFFVVSVLAVLQFAPIYAHKKETSPQATFRHE